MPYRDSTDMLSAEIFIDSIWRLGPASGIYDSKKQEYYWLKSYSSIEPLKLDAFKNKKGRIRYMKFLEGPLENRIVWLEVDSVVVFDQVIDRKEVERLH